MDHATQVKLGRRLLAMCEDDGFTLAPETRENPAVAYTSPETLAREKQRLFRGPLLVGLTDDVREPGDHVAVDAAGTPIVVSRDREGTLHAFQNVCGHRGAPVVSGRGRAARGFTCPYHAWRYDLAGRLVAASHARGFEGIDREARSMCRLPVAERHGLVYASPVPGQEIDVDAQLGGAEAELAPFDFASYAHFESRVNVREMNWKLVVDTFMEAYHLPSLHESTLHPMFERGLGLFDPFGRNGRLAAIRRTLPGLAGTPEAEWNLLPHTTLLYFLFPNVVFIYQQDHVQLWRVFPKDDSPDRSVAYVSVYTPEPVRSESAARHFQANLDLLMRVTNDEDFDLSERIQRGFHTEPPKSLLYGRNEPALIHYHRELDDALA